DLRQLNLYLALGTDGLFVEDVEDQLLPVDDAGLERVFELPLLDRRKLVVHQQYLGAGAAQGLLELDELAFADVGSTVGLRAMLHELTDRLHACRARELVDLGQLTLGLGSLVE